MENREWTQYNQGGLIDNLVYNWYLPVRPGEKSSPQLFSLNFFFWRVSEWKISTVFA